MEAVPEGTPPPLHGFYSDGDPANGPSLDTEEEEYATPAAPELVHDYRLRSRTVRPSTRARARRNTLPSHRRVQPVPSGTRVRAALKRVRRLEYPGTDTTSQESQESLLWDSAAQALIDPFGERRLWSSSTASTQFDVTVTKTESLSDDMATASHQTSEQVSAVAGPSELQSSRQRLGATSGSGESVPRTQSREGRLPGGGLDTASLLSTETIIPRNPPTPAPRTSRTNTPLVPDQGLNLRPVTSLLQLIPVEPPTVSPRHLIPPHDNASDMSRWSERVARLIMDAEDKVLLFRGANVPLSQIDTVRADAELIAGELRDCYHHCAPPRQADINTCRRGIAEVIVQLAYVAREAEIESSNSSQDSTCSGPSRCSTPLENYLPHLRVQTGPLNNLGGARPRDRSGGHRQDAPARPPPCTGAGANPPPPSSNPPPGHDRQDGGRRQSGGRGRQDRNGDVNGHRDRSDSRDRHYRSNRSRSPPSTALEFERQNVVFLLGLIREDSLEDVDSRFQIDPDTLK